MQSWFPSFGRVFSSFFSKEISHLSVFWLNRSAATIMRKQRFTTPPGDGAEQIEETRMLLIKPIFESDYGTLIADLCDIIDR